MVAASGEVGNHGNNINSVKSGQIIKTNLPAIAYPVIMVVLLIIIVAGAAGIYGCVFRKRRLRRELAAHNAAMFRPIVMNADGLPSNPNALNWTNTNEKTGKVEIMALPNLPT